MQKQAFIYSRFLMHEPEAEVFTFRVKFNFKFQVVSFTQSQESQAAFHSRLAQLSGVDIPLFMTSSVPSSPGPCMDTSIFSTRGYRALCLACSREKTALRWPRTLVVGGRTAIAADAKPGGGERWIQRRGMQEEQQRIMGLYCLCHIETALLLLLFFYSFTNFTCQRPEEHNTACDNSCIISYMALEKICEV